MHATDFYDNELNHSLRIIPEVFLEKYLEEMTFG